MFPLLQMLLPHRMVGAQLHPHVVTEPYSEQLEANADDGHFNDSDTAVPAASVQRKQRWSMTRRVTAFRNPAVILSSRPCTVSLSLGRNLSQLRQTLGFQ